MYQEMPPAARQLGRLERQEEETWIGFYPQACQDPSLAAEILMELERDETLRRRHRGLYLCCQRCIRQHQGREARRQRIGQAVRRLCAALFITLPEGAMTTMKKAGQLALACLPETTSDETDQRQRKLMERDAYAQAERSFRDRARLAADRSDISSPDRNDVQA
jgi:hypothetical protein